MRIGGIASGMDTEQMVKDLMKVERGRVDRLLQQEQRVKWRQEAYNDINRKMANFILNTRKAFSGNERAITRGTVERFDWVKSANSSNEGIVKATATTGAINGTHTVRVDQLAEVASFTTNINDMLNSDGTFNVNKEITIATKIGDSLKEVKLEIDPGKISNIGELVSAINSATYQETENSPKINLGLRAAYDKDLGKLMVTTRETGAKQEVSLKEGTEFFGTAGNAKPGKDSVIYFNGLDAQNRIQKGTNNFSVFGINLQLESISPPGTSINISINANVDGIYNKVQEFVKSYNEMIDEINGLTGQKIFRDFLPLTEEQKKAMSEDDIKRWEEKSKSGLLRQDEGLTRILQSMRSSLYNQVQGTIGQFNHITSLGITTGTYQDGGKLVINEERLKAAISNDPEGVVNLLFKTSDTVVPTSGSQEEIRAARQKQANESGLIQRIYNDMITGMKDIIRRSGTSTDASLFRTVQSNMLIDFVTSNSNISVIDKDLSDINKRIAREEQIIAGREDRYWKQFAAMEKAMNQMQQQGNWLMSQLGMGQ